MSYNATRFQSMHTIRSGMAAYMGLLDAIKQEEATRGQVSPDPEPVVRPYANVSFGPKPAMRMSCYEPNPVNVTYIRAGHRKLHVKFTYAM